VADQLTISRILDVDDEASTENEQVEDWVGRLSKVEKSCCETG
jgi:hypothetical protein